MTTATGPLTLNEAIIACRACPRLVSWREQVAQEKVKRFADDTYWGKAVPSFEPSDSETRILIVGLAPAAHGANRTGRMFTGDRSGEWLYRALHKAGFANQPESVHKDDGLKLNDVRITAVCHCAPPDNKPLPEEIKNCHGFLAREFEELRKIEVIIALGNLAFGEVLKLDPPVSKSPKPKFSHAIQVPLQSGKILIGSYHPSQQNTFTGRLTEPMFDSIFNAARELLNA